MTGALPFCCHCDPCNMVFIYVCIPWLCFWLVGTVFKVVIFWWYSMAGQVQGANTIDMFAQMAIVIVITGTFVHEPT